VFQRVLILALGLALALCAAGCTSADPVITAKGKTVIPVYAGTGLPHASVHLFDEVTVTLPPIAKKGYVWTIVLNDERYFKPLGPIVKQATGATATFLATRAGRKPIRFFALPPTGREAIPSQAYEIRITIQEAG